MIQTAEMMLERVYREGEKLIAVLKNEYTERSRKSVR